MKRLIFFLLLTGCSTIATRREDPATFEQNTARTLQDFQGCFVDQTVKEEVQYLPRRNGGTFSAGATTNFGRYVSWVVDVDDLGGVRHVTIHSLDSLWGKNQKIIAKVRACL